MTTLSSFTPEDADLIVSLPYRVGMHVSYSEDESGELDDTLEMKALETQLREVAEQQADGLVKEIASATLNSKEKWEVWSQGVFNIEPLCEKAIVVLKNKADTDEIKGYVRLCLEVASGVAEAYGEFGDDESEEGTGFVGKIMGAVFGDKSREANHPMNVSAAEDSAIERIGAAMKKALD
jgi:hypothetical protein